MSLPISRRLYTKSPETFGEFIMQHDVFFLYYIYYIITMKSTPKPPAQTAPAKTLLLCSFTFGRGQIMLDRIGEKKAGARPMRVVGWVTRGQGPAHARSQRHRRRSGR